MTHNTEQRLLANIQIALGDTVANALADHRVTDVMLNDDGTLWVERMGTRMKPEGKMDPTTAQTLIRILASRQDVFVNAQNPTLSCELPNGSRFEGNIPPIVTAPTFSIRKKASRIMTMEEMIDSKTIKPDQAARIDTALSRRKNIIVCGSTGSGKTTFTNALLARMADHDPDDRTMIIEDMTELQCSGKNVLRLRSTRECGTEKLLRSSLRQNPDKIIIGEVRGKEAWTLVKAWNTGHSGGCCTLHSDVPDAAGTVALDRGLSRTEQLCAEHPDCPRSERVLKQVIAETVGLVIYLAKTAERQRNVVGVYDVMGYEKSRGYLLRHEEKNRRFQVQTRAREET